MFRTLYGKIAAILLALFLLLGLMYLFLVLFTTRLYIQEGAQRLNKNLARHLVSENRYIENGRINEAALKKSFDMLMDINQNIEVYLLDWEGNLLAYSAPPDTVHRKKVSLEPVQRFMADGEKLPILGDDPRDPRRQKVFSASAIPPDGAPEAYLYIILGSEKYDSVAQMLQGSYILRLSSWIAVAGLIFVFATGLLLFNLLTRRIRRLAGEMDRFKEADFEAPVSLPRQSKRRGGDEIGRLEGVFGEMSGRMIEQVSKIREADHVRRELVSSVSHDLRTPLASLQGYLETLLLKGEKISSQEKEKYLTTALKHSERLGKLVSELFDLAKLESVDARVQWESFHLGELVQDLAQKFQLAAEEKQIAIQVKFPENLPFVSSDIGLMERAVQNLVDNALR
ncbi:MAG: histidine kinase dimerization/phospho-acceptor domain-containing protein, partial [bacterium]|nr:histidine kinase dimerization/phospho-acceptor domain-containing protein [bacterium]